VPGTQAPRSPFEDIGVELACLNTHFANAGVAFDAFIRMCDEADVRVVELGVANRMASHGLDAGELLSSSSARSALLGPLDDAGIRIGALNCFGNPLHPDQHAADADRAGIESTIRLAAELGCRVVTCASGCPGDVNWPVWITWPIYWEELEPAQWDVAWRTWSHLGRLAEDLGVVLALKLHPGQLVYNSTTYAKLVQESGPAIKAGIDPAHLFYQGMDPAAVVRHLGDGLGHIHAKDAVLNRERIALDGTIDASPLDAPDRAWRCAAVGEGHPVAWWRDFLTDAEASGYTGLISIEHEDALLSADEALALNASRLREAGIGS
jgi:sugar phosphate isomerase/epimerase